MNKRVMIGSILGLLAFIFAILGLIMTGWYVQKSEEEILGVTYSISMEYGLSEAKLEADLLGEKTSETVEYDEDAGKIGDVANATKYILIVGMILALLFFIFALLGAMGKMSAMNGMLPMIMGILAVILLLVAVIYFAAAFPGALEDEMGTDVEFEDSNLGIGFFVGLIAAILALVGALMAKVPAEVPMMPMAPPPMEPATPPMGGM